MRKAKPAAPTKGGASNDFTASGNEIDRSKVSPRPGFSVSVAGEAGSDRVHLLVLSSSRLERAIYLALIVLSALVLVFKIAVPSVTAAVLWAAWLLFSWLGWKHLQSSNPELWRYQWRRGFDCECSGELEVEGLWELRPYFILIRYRGHQQSWRTRLLWPDSASVETLKILSGTLFCR